MKYDFMRQAILDDPETKDLKLSDQDVLVVYQYLQQRDENTSTGFRPRLKLTPYVQVIYEPTKERLEQQVTRKIKKNLETFESDIYIADATLDDFIISDEYQAKAVKYARKTIDHKDKFMPGLYLYGENRTGKSYLLSGLANELTKNNVDVIFAFVPDLIRTLRGAISTNQLEQRINILKRATVLILDDLGGENMTPWFRDEIILPILHYRLNANLMVHISSNLTHKGLAANMTFAQKEEDQIKAIRILNRIKDLTKVFNLPKRFIND